MARANTELKQWTKSGCNVPTQAEVMTDRSDPVGSVDSMIN